MKKSLFLVIIVCVAMVCVHTGCTEKKVESGDSTATDSTMVVTDTAKIDTVVESAPMPKAADKLFADFFFDFISKKKVQMARIQFPLKSVNGSQVKMIQRGAWKMERFYQNQEYYTQIFDDARQMAHVAKSKADTVIVEKIHLGNGVVEQYLFNHPEGKWMLAELRTGGLAESSNAGFLTFLQKFFADKRFQMSHVANPLNYYGPDPEDDESPKNVRRKIPAASWSDFIPEVPKGQIYNILYGQKYGEGNEKIFLFKGVSNGLETQLHFRRNGSNWKLVKIQI
jgi:hypothetical protein